MRDKGQTDDSWSTAPLLMDKRYLPVWPFKHPLDGHLFPRRAFTYDPECRRERRRRMPHYTDDTDRA